ncbi:MAG: GDSL-type esterase/lipase family protein [Marinobacterium sp.]|nr:GDSL-type esterase/lipase family protein [Marinobacterium sp.]
METPNTNSAAVEKTVMVYGDSMSWGIIPGSRERQVFSARWPGIMQQVLNEALHKSMPSTQVRVVEACLNGRTTAFECADRPARNGLKHLPMLLASQSPVDLLIVMLGVNDFLKAVSGDECCAVSRSAEGLRQLVEQAAELQPEPMLMPARILVMVQPQLVQPLGAMVEKFIDPQQIQGAEQAWVQTLHMLKSQGIDISVMQTSQHIHLSRVDGVHLDAPEHVTLGLAAANLIITEQLLNTVSMVDA